MFLLSPCEGHKSTKYPKGPSVRDTTVNLQKEGGQICNNPKCVRGTPGMHLLRCPAPSPKKKKGNIKRKKRNFPLDKAATPRPYFAQPPVHHTLPPSLSHTWNYHNFPQFCLNSPPQPSICCIFLTGELIVHFIGIDAGILRRRAGGDRRQVAARQAAPPAHGG